MPRPKPTKDLVIERIRHHVLKGRVEPIQLEEAGAETLYSIVKKSKTGDKNFFGYGGWYPFLRGELGIEPLSKKYLPDRRLHKYIKDALGKGKSSPIFWNESKEPVSPYGHSRMNLYSAAQRRQGSNGKPFFGYGSWYDYLEKHLGVSSLDKRNLTNERLNHYIRMAASSADTMNALHWQNNHEPVSPQGHSLKNLYALARARKKKGRSFFGHGNWRDYLVNELGIPLEPYNVTRRGVSYADDEILEMVHNRLKEGFSTSQKEWLKRGQKGHESPRNVYSLVATREKRGRSFFGHGSWDAFLKNEINVSPNRPDYMPKERVINEIKGLVRKGVPTSTNKLEEAADEKAPSGHNIRQLYSIAQRRGFFGKGSWKSLIDSIDKH
jgi:hypothetical protein